MFKIHTLLAATIVAGSYLSPMPAEGNGYRKSPQGMALLSCDKTPDGLRVSLFDRLLSKPQHHDNNSSPVNVKPGDLCLPALARVPPRFREFATFAQLNGNSNGSGSDSNIDECLIWVLMGDGIGESVVGCDRVEDNLVTTFVSTRTGEDFYEPEPGETCRETLTTLAKAKGVEIQGPFAASLGGIAASGEPIGGLMWTKQGRRFVEVLECNLNQQKQLVTTYRENNIEGIDEKAVGELCLDTLAAGRRGSKRRLKVSNPFPMPQKPPSIDPECLIWDIQGGGIEED
jgi:hypothetical protein